MEISSITTNQSPQFGRKLLPAETKTYKKTVQKGLKVLNKELEVIAHNSTSPSVKKHNTGIGTLLSGYLASFLTIHGVTKIQQEPDNLRSSFIPSPYSPLSTGKNIYMIPLENLTTEEYGNILPQETLNEIVENRPNKEDNTVDYHYVAQNFDRALNIAYNNFSEKSKTNENEKINKLAKDFKTFKQKNIEELEAEAIFNVLTIEHGTEDWKIWNDTDKNLYNIKSEQAQKRSTQRLKSLKKERSKEIDIYMFKQFIVNKEINRAQKDFKEKGIDIIGDAPVAFTPFEIWQNQDLFMEGFALGCPPDYFAKKGQRWGFAVLKPETIFNPDGSLGEGGKLMQKRYEKMFETASGGIRIDHIIGLIDPHIYSMKEPVMTPENSGRIYSLPEHKIFGKYAKTTDDEYSAILTKIVFPAAEKYGLTKDDIVCEDLGEVTPPVQKTMEKYNLTGIGVTQFDYRGKDAPTNKVIMLGSHDNCSFIEYTEDLYKNANNDKKTKKRFNNKMENLAEDTITPQQNLTKYKRTLKNNPTEFIKASFVELFTSPAKRVQIFFADFFGMNKTYNIPGKKENCWILRMPDEIEDYYHKNLTEEKGINLPETLARAIRNKGENFSNKHQTLLQKLDKFAQILKD